MKIIKHLDWRLPSIEIDDGAFNIEITNGSVDILCEWDHGWGGRGSESVSIPTQTIVDVLSEFTDGRQECCCEDSKNVAYYQYVKIDKHMGFVDHDIYTLKPKFCPFCGSKAQQNSAKMSDK